jgi:ankyrin repeat protein
MAGDVGQVRTLLGSPCNIDAPNPDEMDRTALCLAVLEGHSDIVEILLEAGADPNVTDGKDTSPLSWAASEGHENIVSNLLARNASLVAPAGEWTPLIYAAAGGHLNVVEQLLEAGADIDRGDKIGSPLTWALYGKHDDVAMHLLKAGADPQHPGHEGPPLYYAMRANSEQMAHRLLDSGASPIEPATLLIQSIVCGMPTLALRLIKGGADPAVQNPEGLNALSLARELGQEEVVAALENAGCVETSPAWRKWTALPPSKETILGQLDDYAAEFAFPVLDNAYIHLADCRLRVYADDKRWAVVFEVVGSNVRMRGSHDAFSIDVYAYGNCLEDEPGFFGSIPPSSDGNAPSFVTDEEGYGSINPHAQTISIREQSITIPRRPDVYGEIGIDIDLSKGIRDEDLLRALVSSHRDLFRLTKGELCDVVPEDLPPLLVLDQWHHPKVREKPSASPTFQLIADAIACRDASTYQPVAQPNTHWTNWPLGGSG